MRPFLLAFAIPLGKVLRTVASVVGFLAALAAVGAAVWFVFFAFTFDLFCDGGLYESHDAVAVVGAALWLAIGACVILLRRHFRQLLLLYVFLYVFALIVITALGTTIWGPSSCLSVGP